MFKMLLHNGYALFSRDYNEILLISYPVIIKFDRNDVIVNKYIFILRP